MMQLSSDIKLDITSAIDRHPMIVSPNTSLIEVLGLLSRFRRVDLEFQDQTDNESKTTDSPEEQTEVEENEQSDHIIDPSAIGSCVLVMENEQLQGIFTERDVVRFIAAGSVLTGISIGDVINNPVITLKESELEDIFTVLSIFRINNIRHLPILNNQGKLIGIITQKSIRQSLQPLNLLTRMRYVRDVMDKNYILLNENTPVSIIAQEMEEKQIRSVIVTHTEANENNIFHPEGIITERDLVKCIALGLDLNKTLAKDVMRSNFFCLHPYDSLWLAHQEMQTRKVRRLIVIGETGELLGIVSETNLLKALNPADMYVLIEGLQEAIDERTRALQITNERLLKEIYERKRIQEELKKSHDELKVLVDERTAELVTANELLKQDIVEREKVQGALRESEAQSREQANQLKQTLQELKSTQSQLIHTEKMSTLGMLIAGLAHEINNPINFINGNIKYANQYFNDLIGLIDIYEQEYPDQKGEVEEKREEIDLEFLKQDLGKILKSMSVGVDRIKDLVLSLRTFSRIDEAEMKPVNIHDGIESTLLILQHQLKATSERPAVKIIKNYAQLPVVKCFSGQLNQVFMNLISNAVDALEGQGSGGEKITNPEIKITTELTENHQLTIRIADNGPGMTEEVREKLFDAFFTTKPAGKGTGLGLSISYQIVVEKHRGKMECISSPGQGAEFVITIPMNED
jgi:two-component system, NtrC family, sensor kinase